MAPPVRKAALVAHVVSSVGWLGAVLTSLGIALVGIRSEDPELVRAVFLVLEPLGWYVLVPFSVVALLSGLVQSLGTTWGLLRHYWVVVVVVKLAMNLFAAAVLLLYMQTLTALADAARTLAPPGDLGALRSPSPVIHAAGAIVLLVVALVLSIYKPRGLTAYGERRQYATRRDERSDQPAT